MYPIPANATRIRYLESTGTQYVDTGYYPSDETKVRAKFQLTRKSGYSFLGRRTGNESDVFRFGAFGQGDYIFLDYGSGNGYNRILYYAPEIQYDVLEVELGNRYIYDITHNVNTSSASVSFARKSYTFCIFSTNDNTDTGRIFNCDIYDGSTLVRSFVPVRVGQVGYLFDRVSGQLFGNAGTGDFVLGPDAFQQGVIPTRMMAMGVRNKEALGSVEFTRQGGTNTPLYAAGVLSSIPSAWTISLWAKAASTSEYGGFFKLGNQSPGSGVGLGFGSSTFESGAAGTNLVAIRERYAWSSFGAVAPVNSWHHYALAVNGRTLAAYKDGALVSSDTKTLYTDGVCDIAVGTGYAASPISSEKRNFAGNITRLALWDRALSAAEVAQDYADGKNAPTTTSGLQHYWPMQNAKNYLKDKVGSATLTAGTGGVMISTDTPFGTPVPLYTGVSLVGSSVQNNNGILSGFTSSSYATMPFYWTAGASQIEAVIKIHFAQTGSAQGIWGCVGSANAFTPFYYNGPNGPMGSYLSTTGNSWQSSPSGDGGSKRVAWNNSSPLAAGDYVLREIYENGYIKTGRFSSGWTEETNNSLGTIYGAANLVPQLGTNRGSNNPFLGTIDLNYTYLYRDGELWWEGAAGAYRNVKTTYPD